ncbi:MAG: TetR/AcrR family transcriptional regulator [Ignavibacteria bacterium]|jgi:AcrR family transcriptional regulator
MSPRTKQQFEEIRETSRNKILSVALELFAQTGYKETSVSKIAEKASISKGLMYNYFKNKEELLEAVVLEGFNKITGLNYSIKEGEKPVEKLKEIIVATLDSLFENLSYWQLYMALLIQPQVQKKFENKFYEFREMLITPMVEIFKRIGSKNPELDAFLLGMHFDGIALNFVAAPDDFPMEGIKQQLFERYS